MSYITRRQKHALQEQRADIRRTPSIITPKEIVGVDDGKNRIDIVEEQGEELASQFVRLDRERPFRFQARKFFLRQATSLGFRDEVVGLARDALVLLCDVEDEAEGL